jgi:centromere protein J
MEELKDNIEKKIESEKSKFKKEKRVFERQNKAMLNLPNRREREEIDALVKQLKQLEEGLKMKDQRNKLTTERLRKQVNEARERNDELIEERENVFKAVKGMSYIDEESKQEVMHDSDREERKDSETNNNQKPAQSWKRPEQINFYQPVNEESKGKDVIDLGISHSPHFGSKADKLEDRKGSNSLQQIGKFQNNLIKPDFGAHEESDRESECEGDENISDEQPGEMAENQNHLDDSFDATDYDMKFLPQYHNNDDSNKRIIQENISADGKIVRWYSNQKKEVIFK